MHYQAIYCKDPTKALHLRSLDSATEVTIAGGHWTTCSVKTETRRAVTDLADIEYSPRRTSFTRRTHQVPNASKARLRVLHLRDLVTGWYIHRRDDGDPSSPGPGGVPPRRTASTPVNPKQVRVKRGGRNRGGASLELGRGMAHAPSVLFSLAVPLD